MLPKPASAVAGTGPTRCRPPRSRRRGPRRSGGRRTGGRACRPHTPCRWSRSGPRSPYRIETAAPEAFAIIIGTRNGDTRRSPLLESDDDLLFERVHAADAGTEDRAESRADSAVSVPACSIASAAAATANCSTEVGPASVLGRRIVRRGVPVRRSRPNDRHRSGPGPAGRPRTLACPCPHGATTPRAGDRRPGALVPSSGSVLQSFAVTSRRPAGTVSTPSSSSSGTATSNSSSSAMTSSTRSRLSASRSSPNLASGSTAVSCHRQHLDGALAESGRTVLDPLDSPCRYERRSV